MFLTQGQLVRAADQVDALHPVKRRRGRRWVWIAGHRYADVNYD